MSSNYASIIRDNLTRLFQHDPLERAAALPARLADGAFSFRGFGADVFLTQSALFLDGRPEEGPRGIILSLYALHATAEECRLEPLRSFKQMPDSAPYAGAFTRRTELALVPFVDLLKTRRQTICTLLNGGDASPAVGGDLSFIVHPLPKIALCYICHFADEDFPAAVTCLYSANADRFLPTDALADVGEYTSKALLELLERASAG